MRKFGWLVVAVAAAACGCSSGSGGSGGPATAGGVQLMAGFNPGVAPDPSKGFQVVAPIVTGIGAGASIEYCTWTDIVLKHDIWINQTEGMQTESGHHVILFYEPHPKAPTTKICSNADMAEFQFGMPASGGKTGTTSLPGNLATHLPAGSQIVVNHHYLNATASTVAQAQSALNVYYADPSVPHVTSSAMTILDTELTVPTGASTFTLDCTVDKPYATWTFFPHMHNWGTHVIVDHTSASGTNRLYDIDWNPDYAFDFAAVSKASAPSKPYVFQQGDKIHVECDYMNNTGAPMTFGAEMCVFNAFTVDSNNIGAWDCDHGHWGQF
jgi:hypothetical protein